MLYVVVHAFEAAEADELALEKGESVMVVEQDSGGWWYGHRPHKPKALGFFPASHVAEFVCEEQEDSLSDMSKALATFEQRTMAAE